MNDHSAIFTPQYAEFSGEGSTEEYSAPYRQFLIDFIEREQIKFIFDLGCGDMEVMGRVMEHFESQLLRAFYLGVDCIQKRIELNQQRFPWLQFSCGDLRDHVDLDPYDPSEPDLILCKDVIQHWATSEIQEWLRRLLDCRPKFALITNCNYGDNVNADIETGGWRPIDLLKPPFSLPGEVVFRWNTKDVVLLRGKL